MIFASAIVLSVLMLKIWYRNTKSYKIFVYIWTSVLIFASLSIDFSINFQLLLAVGTKLEHVITQLAHEVAEKHIAIEGELVVKPSDEHFWFAKPRVVLFLIHFILFQNAFEIAFFFWIWVCYILILVS